MKRLLTLSMLLLSAPLWAQIQVGVLSPSGAAGGGTPAFVQSWKSPVNWCNAAACNLTIAPTAGNVVVVDFIYRSDLGTLSSVADNKGDTTTVTYTAQTGIGTNRGHAQYCFTAASGVTTITITWNATAFPAAVAMEFSNLTCTVDGQSSNSTQALSPVTSGSITPTAGKKEVLMCGVYDSSNAPAVSATFTDPGPSGGSFNDGAFDTAGYLVVTSTTGSYTCSATAGGGNMNIAIAALKGVGQ